jgi:RimJ/RimL family protein N-acetyltransferase
LLTRPFDLQPTLKGELVELRPLRPDDFDQLFAVASDPLIWEQHPVKDRCEPEGFRRFFQEAMDSRGALIAIDTATSRIIGSSRFHAFDEGRSEVEIGWTFLARSHWGGRYNGEMKRLMLQHAFQFVNRVIFIVGVRNIRSQRAVEAIGGVCTGSRVDPGGRDSYVFEITAARFRQHEIETSEHEMTTGGEQKVIAAAPTTESPSCSRHSSADATSRQPSTPPRSRAAD